MSDYHILTQSVDQKTIQVIFHISVPNVINKAEINYRTALKKHLEFTSDTGIIKSACPNITGTELAQLEAGEILEVVQNVRFSILGLTSVQKGVELDIKYKELKVELLQKKQIELEWWGLDKNVI